METLAASVLAADFARLEAHAREALDAGADWLHIDVMDGHFVPNITMGPLAVRALRPLADDAGAPLDVHLMIENPERYVGDFAEAGADLITVHEEACPHLHRVVQQIREAGARAGVAINPATPVAALDAILPDVDLVLVMSVNPGFGGQAFLPRTLERLRDLRGRLSRLGAGARLEVDGGIGPENAREIVDAGADVLVAGSAVFGGEQPVTDSVEAFHEALALKA